MTNPQRVRDLIESTAYDCDGDKIGKVGHAYLNDASGDAEWVTVHTGFFGARESLVPLYGAQGGAGELRLAVSRQLVKDAPHVGAGGSLEGTDVDALYQHYAGHTGRAGSVPADQARLRKYVVTENVTQPAPVSHEEIRLEPESVSDATQDAR